MTDPYQNLNTIQCRNCGNENPPKAYCCLSCFKVLRPKESIPWYRLHIRPSIPTAALMICAALFGIFLLKRWMEGIEAQVTMNFKGDEYNVSVVADKRKKDAMFDVTKTVDPVPSDQ